MKKHIIYSTACFLLNAGMISAQSDSTKINTTTTTTTSVSTTSNQPAEAKKQEDGNSDDGTGLYIGARFMPTVTKFEVKTISEGVAKTTFVVGYGAGGFIGYNFSNNIGLQAEVIYSVLSQKYTDQQAERKIELSYLHIPLLFVLNTDVSKPINLNFAVGPQIGINTGSKIDSEGSQGVDTVTAVIAVKPGDLGLAYGVGIDFKIGPSISLGLGFRGVYGILDISDNNKTTTTNQYYILDRSHVKTYAGYAGLTFKL